MIRRWFALAASIALVFAAPRATVAQSAPAPGTGDACGVRVASVTPLDPRATLHAVVLERASDATAPAGSIALFTSANRRYDVPFDGSAPAGTAGAGAPVVVLVRFPASATVTGAYVASLAGNPPVACAIADPWTAGVAPDDAATQAVRAAIAAPFFDRNAVAVSGAGLPDPLPCRTPAAPARVVHEVPPEPSFFASAGALPHGTIVVHVVVGPDGHAIDAQIDHADESIDETAAGTTIKSTALVAALHSTYAPATFRCRPISGIAAYTITYRART